MERGRVIAGLTLLMATTVLTACDTDSGEVVPAETGGGAGTGGIGAGGSGTGGSTATGGGGQGGGGPECGNGALDPGEACDDGNQVDGDGCNSNCVESGTLLWSYTLDPGCYHDLRVDEDDSIRILCTDKIVTVSAAGKWVSDTPLSSPQGYEVRTFDASKGYFALHSNIASRFDTGGQELWSYAPDPGLDIDPWRSPVSNASFDVAVSFRRVDGQIVQSGNVLGYYSSDVLDLIDAAGTVVWSKKVGDYTYKDSALTKWSGINPIGLAMNDAGSVFVVGGTSPEFPYGNQSIEGYAKDGTTLLSVVQGQGYWNAVTFDSQGNLYTTGRIPGGTAPTQKTSPNGQALWQAEYVNSTANGQGVDSGLSIAVDSAGNAVVGGSFGNAVGHPYPAGPWVAKYDLSGTLVWVWEGTGDDADVHVATDSADNVVALASFTTSTSASQVLYEFAP